MGMVSIIEFEWFRKTINKILMNLKCFNLQLQ